MNWCPSVCFFQKALFKELLNLYFQPQIWCSALHQQDVVLKTAVFIINVFLVAFGQQWTSMAQKNQLYQALVTQTVLHPLTRFILRYHFNTCGPFLAHGRSWHTFTFCTFSLGQLQKRLCGLQVQLHMMDVPLLHLHLLRSLMGGTWMQGSTGESNNTVGAVLMGSWLGELWHKSWWRCHLRNVQPSFYTYSVTNVLERDNLHMVMYIYFAFAALQTCTKLRKP